jgi:predicted aminopeptidase
MRTTARASLLLCLSAALAGCSPGYVLRAAWEEARILGRREPIARIVADPATDWETRDRLMLVLQARRFAADSLSLAAGNSYTLFARVDSDTLVMVLSAAYPDRLEAYTWWFPVVGRVPYKGFFDPADAERARDRLAARGFDTYLRPSAAFSTLGWFNDPLLSTLLRYDRVSLVNTVVHELFHNTFWAPGHVAFNESLANFVGARGAIEFFCGRDGPDGPECATAVAAWEDEMLFGAFLQDLVDRAEALYARDLTSAEKVAARGLLFDEAQRRFREEVQPRLRVSGYGSFTREPLNNATLLARRFYYRRLDLFEAVHRAHGGDFRAALAAIVAAARHGREDPFAAVEELLGR